MCVWQVVDNTPAKHFYNYSRPCIAIADDCYNLVVLFFSTHRFFDIPELIFVKLFHTVVCSEINRFLCQSAARLGRPYQTRWESHHPFLISVVPLGHGVGQVNVRIDITSAG